MILLVYDFDTDCLFLNFALDCELV